MSPAPMPDPPKRRTAPPEAGRDARALITYLERRVGELTDDLSQARRVAEEARLEARESRIAAEALRVQAGQVDVLTALVAAERAHLSEVRVDRDRLVALLTERPTPWLGKLTSRLRKAA